MNQLPVNFETKLKEARRINTGYPFSIKAEDLMKDFVHASLSVDSTLNTSGLYLEETTAFGDNGHLGRIVKLAGNTFIDHPWRVSYAQTSGNESVRETDIGKIRITGGIIFYDDHKEFVVDDKAIKVNDNIYLKIKRIPNSRIIEKVTIEGQDESFDDESKEDLQYWRIAQIREGVIYQIISQNIAVFEDLAVVNGEFQLVPLVMLGKSFYDVPAP